MDGNSPNLGKETDIHIQEVQRVPKKNWETHTRHIIIKLSNIKDTVNHKSSKRKTTVYIQGNSHKTISNFQ